MLPFSRNGHNWIASHIFLYERSHRIYEGIFVGIMIWQDVKTIDENAELIINTVVLATCFVGLVLTIFLIKYNTNIIK